MLPVCDRLLASLRALPTCLPCQVPVAVISGLDSSVIRTAPIFTNVRNLWQSHLKLHEVRQQQQNKVLNEAEAESALESAHKYHTHKCNHPPCTSDIHHPPTALVIHHQSWTRDPCHGLH